ncbi:MAG: hypothetical protein M1514_00435 [Patescibacteria group bacterium]|nr:hypothetical protein [Patescibacteria group bacterium]
MTTNLLLNEEKNSFPATTVTLPVIAAPIQRLISQYQEGIIKERTNSATIHVDEIASKVARIYERIRKIVDWKEENLLRRNAIERILKRSLISELSNLNFLFKINVSATAEELVLELIRGGHLPNDEISKIKIDKVKEVLDKYLYFLKNAPYTDGNFSFLLKKKVNFFDWVLEIAACEIEEVLTPLIEENSLIEAMTVLMNERLIFNPPESLSTEEKFIQTYIAVHRTLFDLDEAIISYHLLKLSYPEWTKPSEEFMTKTAQNIFIIKETISAHLTNPFGKDFFNICERTDTVFTLLGDFLEEYQNKPNELVEIIENKISFKKHLVKYYNERLNTLKSRLFKLGVFSTLSVFVSNWFTFFVVEVPLAHLFYEGFNALAAVVDFIIPSLTMFILVAMIKPPSESNLDKTIKMVFNFVYDDTDKEIYEIKPKKKRKFLTNIIIILLYLLACSVTFGAIAWAFYKATIPITSVIFDTIGIALNVFAALVIRNKAKEITVEERSSLWEFFLDILSIPVAEIGSWFANKWKEYNVISVFFNVVIEIPFVSFISFIEDWRQFLKERKADIH